MTYKVYKMIFESAHFGQGRLSESDNTFTAARLFSALVLEAIKQDIYDEFMQLANDKAFRITDAFPGDNYSLYLPKPIGYPESFNETEDLKSQRRAAKNAKKIKFLPEDSFEEYLSGEAFEEEPFSKQQNTVKKGADPYEVGVTYFYSDKYLYVIASQSPLLDQLMKALQYSGIGGKRTAGLGRFELSIEDLPDELVNKISTRVSHVGMTLTTAFPDNNELENATKNARYMLHKQSGFAYSTESEANYRKKNMYLFTAGSTFDTSYTGNIFDVKPVNFPHAVWLYARPLFYELGVI